MRYTTTIYDEDEKTSYTKIEHLGRTFIGTAKLSPEEEFPSELFGGRLSESRAVLKALQYEKELRWTEYHAIENLVKSCCNTKKFDKESPSAKVLFHQLNISKKKYEKIKAIVKSLKSAIKEMMDDRDRFFTKRAKEDKEKE